MLRSLKSLQRYKAISLDGPIGSVFDFYLDDFAWIIRYLVVDLGGWLPGRKVLISPAALSQPDWDAQAFPLKLTKKEIENSPDIDTDKPIFRQQEVDLHRYYQWPAYWNMSGALLSQSIGTYPNVERETTQAAMREEEAQIIDEKMAAERNQSDPHLRSSKEVIGYHIQGRDDEAGHVEDFIVNDANWAINYLVVDTRNWLPGKKVLVSPHWIEEVEWISRNVYFDLSAETIKNSPEYDPSAPVNQEYEAKLYDYYGRPKN